jgi:hypothetical protein
MRVALALLVCACATQGTQPKTAHIDDELVAMVPSGGDALGELDLVRVRAWGPGEKMLHLLPTEVRDELTAEVGFDVFTDVDRVVIWWRRRGGPQDHVMFARGRFDANRLRATAIGHGGKPVDYRGVTTFEMPGVASALLRPDLFLLGTRSAVRTTIDAARGAGPSLLPSEPLALLRAQQPAHATVQIVGINPEDPPPPPGLRTLAVRVDLDGGFDLTATIEHVDPAAATANEQQLRDQTENIRRQLVGMGAAEYLDGLIVASQGTKVLATFRLTTAQCDRLAELAARFVPFWLLQQRQQRAEPRE